MKIKESQLSEEEKKVIKYIEEYKEEDYLKVIEQDNDIQVMLNLSDIRENIIDWYPFEKNCNILEIGADLGQITGVLCKKAYKVISLENSEEKRIAIANRHKNKKNLKIISKIEEIEEKFDYITIIGIERLTDFPNEMLRELRKYLKENGKILMATDNKFGIKYFASTDDTGEDITNLINKKLYKLDELIKQIDEAGFKNRKIYYPMTDYKLTNVIFTDKKLLSKNNLSINIIYNSEDTIRFYEQNGVYRELLEEDENIFKMFANSFFIEIFNGDYKENEIRLVAFSNMRKPQYRIKTIMEKEFVYKYPQNSASVKHIENVKANIDIMKKMHFNTLDNYDKKKIVSKYSAEKTLDKIILNLAKKNKSEAIELIKKFRQELIGKLEIGNIENNVFDKYNIIYDKKIIENMKFIKYGLWDLIFQNCFYINQEFYFFDQEWREDNVPIDFILYRAIKYLNQIKQYISEKELYEVLEINNDRIQIFDELDDKLQDNIKDNLIWKINTQGKTILDLKREKLTDNHTINILKIENNKLRQEIDSIIKSKSWKITAPLRKIRKLKKQCK